MKEGLSAALGPGGDLMGSIIDSDRRRAGRVKSDASDASNHQGGENTTSNMVVGATSSTIAKTTSSKAAKTTGGKQPDAGDSMRQALLDFLAQPYSTEPKYTVTSMKIETEVLERPPCMHCAPNDVAARGACQLAIG